MKKELILGGGEGMDSIDSHTRSRTGTLVAGYDGDGGVELQEAEIARDIFLCVDREEGVDSSLGRAIHKALKERFFDVADLIDDSVIARSLDYRDGAILDLQCSGCLIFLQTAAALCKPHGYCQEILHTAYEAGCPIIVLELNEGREQVHANMALQMMLQMAPKVLC